jgi:hypothetical protein
MMTRSCFSSSSEQQDNRQENFLDQFRQQQLAIPTIRESERLVAEALTQLSFQERNEAINDLHGIRSRETLHETKDCFKELSEMDEWLEQLTVESPDSAYQLAKRDCPSYIQNSTFRLYFFKATDSGSPKEAAKRMIDYFQFKLALFGRAALCQTITLSHLNKDDIQYLESGFYQELGKDTIGRTIVGCFPSQMQSRNVHSFVSSILYYRFTVFTT